MEKPGIHVRCNLCLYLKKLIYSKLTIFIFRSPNKVSCVKQSSEIKSFCPNLGQGLEDSGALSHVNVHSVPPRIAIANNAQLETFQQSDKRRQLLSFVTLL